MIVFKYFFHRLFLFLELWKKKQNRNMEEKKKSFKMLGTQESNLRDFQSVSNDIYFVIYSHSPIAVDREQQSATTINHWQIKWRMMIPSLHCNRLLGNVASWHLQRVTHANHLNVIDCNNTAAIGYNGAADEVRRYFFFFLKVAACQRQERGTETGLSDITLKSWIWGRGAKSVCVSAEARLGVWDTG